MNHAAIETLQQFMQMCQSLQMQLKEDQSAFAKHAFNRIQDSNHKKADMLSALVTEINRITMTFNLNPDLPFLKALEGHGEKMEKGLRGLYQQTVEALHKQLLLAYEVLLVNTQVVDAQLQQVKMVIDQVHQFETRHAYVYSGNKVIEK